MSNLQPLSCALSPAGRLYLYAETENHESVPLVVAEKLQNFFALGHRTGLLRLGLINFGVSLPQSLAYWQGFSQFFLTEHCKLSGLGEQKILPPLHEFERYLRQAPFMRGSEFLSRDVLAAFWQDLSEALSEELACFDGNLQKYLHTYNPALNSVGRVCFHLAENKSNELYPFAFLATYITRLSSSATLQHVPLGRALKDYAINKAQLLALLLPVQKAAELSALIRGMIDSGAIFQPQTFNPNQAHQFLQAIPLFEAAGLMVRVPNWWNPKKPPRPQIKISVGNKQSSKMGLNALLDFDMNFALPSGENIRPEELQELLEAEGGLIQVKGQWVQVDKAKLVQVLEHWKRVERQVKSKGLSFFEGMRLLASAPGPIKSDASREDISWWSEVTEGPWLSEALGRLRSPELSLPSNAAKILAGHLHATLRPYQEMGLQWLFTLYTLGLGGCLADDMGLGKTIQVLSFLLLLKTEHAKISKSKAPHLLVLPASLLGNWQAEIRRFAPELKVKVAHSSSRDFDQLKDLPELSEVDLVITTYAFAHRLPWLAEISWDCVILDEAQSIKNPNSKQSRTLKALPSNVRFTLTGTPIENRLLDLWSLFDFAAPGLLGSSKAFADYGKTGGEQFNAAVRQLVRPYILRRLKSDKSIISDLPDKTELDAYCSLSKQQVLLYQQAVDELKLKLSEEVEGIKRSGLVLSFIMRFKQICNHPSQWLGHGGYSEASSGKFSRLRELCEAIAAKQEKVLVFTQFREIIVALADFLAGIFGRPGLTLHGQTHIKERHKLVEAFQTEHGPPFFVLSLKAGGTGLNLTNAAHVIHFDRWWNPAVENQATDRAYRIGQKGNVLVHKFICRGTIEEKIDAMINSKKSLADVVLGNDGQSMITKLSDEELIRVVSLDIHRALEEQDS